MKNFQVVKNSAIYRQQVSHLVVDDPSVTEEYLKNGWNLKIQCQPLNSPNLNVLNLELFSTIQSL